MTATFTRRHNQPLQYIDLYISLLLRFPKVPLSLHPVVILNIVSVQRLFQSGQIVLVDQHEILPILSQRLAELVAHVDS